jgi:hypothetical protein
VGCLTKGSHRLVVSAKDKMGEIGDATIEFVVDSTGRYTAVPRVQPQVDSTKFC